MWFVRCIRFRYRWFGFAITFIMMILNIGVVSAVHSEAPRFALSASHSCTNSSQQNGKVRVPSWIAPDGRCPISFAEWQNQLEAAAPFSVQQIETPVQSGQKPIVAVIVNPKLYTSISTALFQWILDVIGAGWRVDLYIGTFPDPLILRGFLTTISQLRGVLLIGDFPVPWYEIDGEEFPIDLFYMDLDGIWEDNDRDGMYDAHSGNRAPELWVGRLTAGTLTLGGNESTLINAYFAKNHAYRMGQLRLPKRVLVYIDDDWAVNTSDWGEELRSVYSNTTVISEPDATTAADYKQRLDGGYEWVQIHSHSWAGGHALREQQGAVWEQVVSQDVIAHKPRAFFFNLYACAAARFVEQDYIGGWYIFADGYGLAAVGSTKGGAMHGFRHFYEPFHRGSSLGTAFRNWFTVWGLSDPAWHYGMILLGDPTLIRPAFLTLP